MSPKNQEKKSKKVKKVDIKGKENDSCQHQQPALTLKDLEISNIRTAQNSFRP